MVQQGASILDIGGQSYAHFNPKVAEDEELRRVVPVVEALVAEKLPVALSIDTYRPRVVRAVLEAGAHLINDCSGLSVPEIAAIIAEFDAALVVMHLKGELNVREVERYRYDEPVREIADFLGERAGVARAAGVAADSIVIDPGLEFGKEPETDLELLDRFRRVRTPRTPDAAREQPEELHGPDFQPPGARAARAVAGDRQRSGGSAGARLFRVHDVAETVRFLGMLAVVKPERRRGLALAAEMPR